MFNNDFFFNNNVKVYFLVLLCHTSVIFNSIQRERDLDDKNDIDSSTVKLDNIKEIVQIYIRYILRGLFYLSVIPISSAKHSFL